MLISLSVESSLSYCHRMGLRKVWGLADDIQVHVLKVDTMNYEY